MWFWVPEEEVVEGYPQRGFSLVRKFTFILGVIRIPRVTKNNNVIKIKKSSP